MQTDDLGHVPRVGVTAAAGRGDDEVPSAPGEPTPGGWDEPPGVGSDAAPRRVARRRDRARGGRRSGGGRLHWIGGAVGSAVVMGPDRTTRRGVPARDTMRPRARERPEHVIEAIIRGPTGTVIGQVPGVGRPSSPPVGVSPRPRSWGRRPGHRSGPTARGSRRTRDARGQAGSASSETSAARSSPAASPSDRATRAFGPVRRPARIAPERAQVAPPPGNA
jgi:hypothetical protein